MTTHVLLEPLIRHGLEVIHIEVREVLVERPIPDCPGGGRGFDDDVFCGVVDVVHIR